MENKFVIDFNGRGCETPLPDKPCNVEEYSDENEDLYILIETYDLVDHACTVCVFVSALFADFGFRFYCPTWIDIKLIWRLLEDIFGKEKLSELINKK